MKDVSGQAHARSDVSFASSCWAIDLIDLDPKSGRFSHGERREVGLPPGFEFVDVFSAPEAAEARRSPEPRRL